ncbi:MAG: stage V sporulation protein D [Syntrophomonadaceae bacterium]|nr:stage V sporulation protein D [Syntrophomonadaceae bacterium]
MQTNSLLIKKRIITLFLLFIIGFLGLSGRIFWVQFIDGKKLSSMAENNRMRDVPVAAKRGIIYDRNGQELAISVSADSVYACPIEVRAGKKERETAHQLAEILDMDEEKLLKRITRASSYEWIKRQIKPAQAKKIRDLELPGIRLAEESHRQYPNGTLASHVLGISGVDNTGLEGIDNYYDKLVGGTAGRIVIEKDAANRPIPEATHRYIPPVEGANLVLTIDQTIQYITERELEKAYKERDAKSASAIVMDPNTGEILALACRPTYNPNQYENYPAAYRRNPAINDAYEPGSTMKIVTSSIAMAENVVDAQSRFFCPGYVKVGKETINCAQGKAHGSQSFAEIVENSCNVGFVAVGLALGVDKYYDHIYDFGFGKKTGIDLPGEAAGIIVPEGRCKQIDLATMAMGQANAVTTIQLAAAVSAVANGGKLIQPHLVKQVIDNKGKVVKEFKPVTVRRVLSENTARQLSLILEGEVIRGTGTNAAIEGYRVGGKTGTAQKIAPGGGYLPNSYVSSFVGFAPVDNPKLLCIFVVDSPKGYPYFGAWVAAPPFKEIVQDSLRYLQIPAANGIQPTEPVEEVQTVLVPDLINLTPSEASSALVQRGLKVRVEGSGMVVYQQTPQALTRVQTGTEVIVNLSPYAPKNKENQVTIPDLRGKSMKEVVRILSSLGLYLVPEGHGLASSQSPVPGKVVSTGSRIKVQFTPISQ